MRRALLGAALPLALVLTACDGPENPYRPFPEPDWDVFVARVQPMAGPTCATLGCHGDHERRLTLYSVGGLRSDPTVAGDPLDDAYLAESELGWNYNALRMRIDDEEEADRARLLLKCLDPALGGTLHAGDVVVFASTEEPGYVLLRDWIESGL